MDIDTLNKIKGEGDDESFRKNNNKLLEKTDPAAVEEVVNEQIKLLGSELLYQRINKNFLEHKFEAFFAKEQFKLFAWREKFFFRKFGSIWTGTWMNWITCGSDDSYLFETVPYHITKNFKEVTALACSTDYRPNNGSYVFFENDDELSSTAKAMFDPKPLSSRYCSLDKDELEESGVNFQDVAHMIMALHRIGPCTLLESAMKTVLLHRLPIHDIPKELQQKALQGLYSDDVKGPVPSNISSLGWRYFCRYRDEFSAMSDDGSSAFSDDESSAVSED